MIGALKRAYDGFRGFGDYAFSVPPLDGAFLPNSVLDSAPVICRCPQADNLVVLAGVVHFSSGAALMRLAADGAGETLDNGAGEITALAATAEGALYVAREGGATIRIGADGSRTPIAAPRPGSDVTAMCARADGTLAVAIGAEGKRRRDWQLDLMTRGRTGSVWTVAADGAARQLEGGLAYPLGSAEAADGALIVSVAWDHALIRLDRAGKVAGELANLPGYPGRVIPAQNGGFLLSFLSIRNQLVEFVLREPAYVRRMMAEIDREFWICPMLKPPSSPEAVMQAGAERHHGEMKPWAPSLSYGLIAGIGAGLLPEFAWHSRANGDRHGLTSLALAGGRLLASSRGAGGIIDVPQERPTDEHAN